MRIHNSRADNGRRLLAAATNDAQPHSNLSTKRVWAERRRGHRGSGMPCSREAPMIKSATISPIVLTAALLVPSPGIAATIVIPFTPANFSNPLTINNVLFPLVPNTTFVYKEDTPDGCELDRMSVTNQTLVLDGVTTRAVHDIVYVGSSCSGRIFQKTEDTIDYYAQDNNRNV